ncbi:AAA family ATPase [Polynucleobacter sp. JS-Polo-80-F4]|uniref:AAA family ATPase n=1 Tax=Polynucleobacter sp. JS-Polo-80-F4 TaxID=2576918 RepID=UPI001C0E183D|nr:AAA family ATPase [Polynucleobacter sp. JS-Polo-80-F4]MBU3615841.1 AAA family ATPase [Polynucleobacter sp. JS-Polo-80-F4]
MNRTFRLFISSTFSDFMLEREALQARVFPRLEEYCNSRGAKFLAIDLRWGITEAAQVEHDTLRICLDEIRRSQELSPRPNFAVLLGNRYGWEPIPARIPESHWSRLLENLSAVDQKIIRSAYYAEPDTNAIPPTYLLKPREGDWAANEANELAVRNVLHSGASAFSGEDRLPYFSSATHQEIVLGALQTADAKEHVHVYIRAIDELPFSEDAKAFIDWDAKAGQLVAGAKERLAGLEIELRNRLPGMVRDYKSQWLGHNDLNLISDDYLDNFCEQFYQDQIKLINLELTKISNIESYEIREKLHDDFARDRCQNFVGRESVLALIKAYVESIYSKSSGAFAPLSLHGEGGTGKSAIIAFAYQGIKNEFPNALVLARFIGGVPGTEDIGPILRDLIEDICRYYQSPVPQAMIENNELYEAFNSVLQLSSQENPLIIFLDAIDQLSNADSAWLMEWLPKQLNTNTRLILTTRDGITFDNIKRRIPSSLNPIPPMSHSDGEKMLDAWLSSYREARFNAGIAPAMGRALTVSQRQSVLEQFRACPKPLWLKLVYEQVRNWRSWDQPIIFPNEIKGIVSELINDRLFKDDKHLPIFTRRALAYIAAGRFGLSEDELANTLGVDEDVKREFQAAEKTDKKWPLDRNVLPPILWSRLYFDLAPYLSSVQIDGSVLFRFFHREFKKVIEGELLNGQAGELIHSKLANRFSQMGGQNIDLLFKQADASGLQQSAALRRLMEEPWQLAKAKQQNQLIELLTSFGFCMAKCAANRSGDLAADYLNISAAQKDLSLSTVAWREIILSQNHLLARGDSIWPAHKILLQLANEHADNSAITLAAQDWLESGACNWAWARNRNRPNTFYPSPMLGVMAGHSGQIRGVLPLSDGRILSWSADRTLRIWDSQTGKQLYIMEGHLDGIDGIELLPDDMLLSWCSSLSQEFLSDFGSSDERDDALRIWDLKTGSPVAILEGHSDRLNGAIAMPNHRVLSWSDDKTLRLWSYFHDVEVKVLSGHTQSISGAQQLSDGRILSWSEDATLRIWNGISGELENILIGHQKSVTGVEVLPDGRLLSWSKDCTLRLWDAKTGIESMVFSGHTKSIVGVLVLADGHLLSWSEDGSLRVWDLNTGIEIVVMLGHTKAVSGVQLLSDGRMISWSRDGTARLWNVQTGNCLFVLEGHADWVNGIFELAGNRLLTWSDDNTLRLWNGENGDQIQIMKGHKGAALNARLLSDGLVLSWTTDGPLRLWDSTTGQLIGLLDGHTESVLGAASLDRSRIVSWSYDRTLRLWDIELSQSSTTVMGHSANIGGHKVLEDGRVLSWARDGTLMLWDGQNGTPLVFIEGHHDYIWGAKYLPSGHLLSWSGDGNLRMWDSLTGKLIQTFTGHTKDVRGARLLPNGRLMSWSIDGTIRIWDESTAEQLLLLQGHTSYVAQVDILPDGNFLSWSGDNTIRIWSCHDGQQLAMMNGDHKAGSMDEVRIINKDRVVSTASGLFTKSKDFALKLWDTHTGMLVATLEGHQDSIKGFAVLPDSRILSWSEDSTIRLWDGMTGAALVEMAGHKKMVLSASMLPDGKVLSLSSDGAACIWDGLTGELLTTLLDEKSPIHDVTLLLDGKVLSSSKNGTLNSWDLDSGKCMMSCRAPWLKDTVIPAEWESVLPRLKFDKASRKGGVWTFPSRESILFVNPKQNGYSMWNGIDVKSPDYSGSSHFLQTGRNLVFLKFMDGAVPIEEI